MRFRLLSTFERDYKKLPGTIQQQVERSLALLNENPRHPSLHTKRIRGTPDIWEARVSRSYRLTFNWEGDTVTLRRVGTHDILERESRSH